MSRKSIVWLGALLILVLASSLACNVGGPSEPTAVPTQAPAATEAPTQAPKATEPPETTEEKPTPTEEVAAVDPLLVTDLEDVKLAVVQIEAEGSFVDPQFGLMANVAGSGSGFIIDESGIAVTNNHVVTGAALLRVWVGGEDEPRNARVLGVSECSDLAVIDIEGDGFHYLQWHEEPVHVGLDVYAAGFPLGDPEFTLTGGIVSKEEADGDTDWASIGSVIEHDATINPGNSGGPLVDESAQVVGVNYASSPDYNQYFAISYDEARRVLDSLQGGSDVASIGVNGTAISDGRGTNGIWVASVDSGSPAERAGVLPGDVITAIEGYGLASDGTMASYCDILRSHHLDDVMSLQVLRYDTEEVLEGQLNGDPLTLSFSFAQELGQDVVDTSTTNYSDYVEVTDDTGAIVVEIPAEWNNVDGSVWEDEDGVMGAAIVASSDLDAFNEGYTVPGVVFMASASMAEMGDASDLLDTLDFSDDCLYEGRETYDDSLYSGYYDLYSGCAGTDTILVVVAALPPDGSYATLLAVQAISDADLDAIDHILNTFVVVGTLPDETGGGTSGGGSGDASLTVYNDTDEAVWFINISPSTSDSWGDDWLGDDVILSGDYYTFYMPAGTYDLRALDPDENVLAERYGEEISGDMEWTLYLDETGSSGGDQGVGYHELTLENYSDIDVCYVFISPSTSDSWGDDWLGESDVIPVGTIYTFYLPGDVMTWDLQAADCEGVSVAEEYEVYFDTDKVWTLTPQ